MQAGHRLRRLPHHAGRAAALPLLRTYLDSAAAALRRRIRGGAGALQSATGVAVHRAVSCGLSVVRARTVSAAHQRPNAHRLKLSVALRLGRRAPAGIRGAGVPAALQLPTHPGLWHNRTLAGCLFHQRPRLCRGLGRQAAAQHPGDDPWRAGRGPSRGRRSARSASAVLR